MRPKTKANWGRWGEDDEKGMSNLLTPELVKNAFAQVKEGKVYSLAAPLGKDGPVNLDRNTTWHIVSSRNDSSPGGGGGADDMLITHVHAATHIDALCHVWYDSQLYNGHSSDSVTSQGASKCAIDNVTWMIGRGILLDIAGLKGVEHLDDRYAITPQDLDDAAEREGVEVRPADIVLVRTGWYRLYGHDYERLTTHWPGLSEATGEWLADHDVCAVGADNGAVEIYPPLEPGRLPVHETMLRDLGGYLLEYVNMEELAADKVYEFLMVIAPLRITGGIGSPINPLAIV